MRTPGKMQFGPLNQLSDVYRVIYFTLTPAGHIYHKIKVSGLEIFENVHCLMRCEEGHGTTTTTTNNCRLAIYILINIIQAQGVLYYKNMIQFQIVGRNIS